MLDKLKSIREESGLTVQETAQRIGITKGYYSMIENGNRGLSYSMAVRISKVFHMKPDDIFFNQEYTDKKLSDSKKEVSAND